MDWRVGTSGYSYKQWVGTFYPEGTDPSAMLGIYAARLPAVEINNTFYRMPKAAMLEGWAEQVPASFRFVIKASRRITHIKRLKDAGSEIEFLTSQTEALGERLGPYLFQLPPNAKADLGRLESFLDVLPDGVRAAFEFRHPTWCDDAVVELLRSRNHALCFVDGYDEDAPMEGPLDLADLALTADWAYLRLRGEDYPNDDLDRLVDHLRAANLSSAWVFFKHEEAGAGAALAKRLLDRAATRDGADD